MKYKFGLISLLLLLFVSHTFGQSGGIKGKIVDASTMEPLIGATVMLNRDTKMASATDLNGNFTIGKIKAGEYSMRITFVGYDSLVKEIVIKNNILDLQSITLKESAMSLKLAEIVETSVMSVQLGDTTQFNAAAFKTNVDATAEDMIKKLPGVTVENGTVNAQGEDVQKIYINGKEAFNSDAKTALTNLQANAIESIQVFDDMSDMSKFTGFDDGNSQKAINIVTKESFKDNTYGKVYFGGGADENPKFRYNGGFDLSTNKGDRTISVTGLFNNVNIQNFGNQRMRRHRGGGVRSDGTSDFYISASPGIVTTNAFGINYVDKWGKKVDVSGSYFFYNKDNDLTQDITQNYDPVGNSPARKYHTYDKSLSRVFNHAFNMKLDWNIDKSNKVIFRPRVNIQTNMGEIRSIAENEVSGTMISSSDNTTKSWLEGYDFGGELTYMHAFAKKGRSLSIGGNGYYGSSNGNKEMKGLTIADSMRTIMNQRAGIYTAQNSSGASISYTEPLGTKSQMLVNYKFSYDWGKADKGTYLYNDISLNYDILDSIQSNLSNSDYYLHKVGIGYKYIDKKAMLDAALDYQYSELANMQLMPIHENFRHTFNAILPSMRFTYKFNKTSNLRMNIRTSTAFPTVEQLQSMVDFSNPLQLNAGNPNLKESYSGRFRLHFFQSDTEKSTSLFAMIGGNFTSGYIGNNTMYIQNDTIINNNIITAGKQISIPVNLNNYWQAMAIVNYGFPIRTIKCNFNIGASYFYTYTPTIYNGVHGGTNDNRFGIRLGFVSNISERIDFGIYSNSSYTLGLNSLTGGKGETTNYFQERLSADIKWNMYKGLFVDTRAQYTVYVGDVNKSQDNQYFIWDMGLAYKFLKNNAAELRLSVNDIFNQNTNINIALDASYSQDTYTTVLQRYYMATFTYKINSKKAKPDTRSGMMHPR